MSVRKFYLFVAVFFVFSAFSVQAQTPTPTPDDETEKIFTEEIKLNVLAFDKSGNFASGVTKDDLVIVEDGRIHQPSSVRRIPANVLIVLDVGNENAFGKNKKMTSEAAIALVNSLQAEDSVAIMQYSDKVEFVALGIKSKAEAYRILRKINEFPTANKTDHLLPLQYLKNKIPRNSISYIMSDFSGITDLTPYKSLLAIHELYGIRITDPIESMDNKVLKNFFIENLETNKGGSYSSTYLSDTEILNDFYRSNLLNLKTDSDLGKSIVRFLNR